MLKLFRTSSWRELTRIELPALLGALAIAELLYKFHSFILEALGFLATWLALELALDGLARLLARGRAPDMPPVTR